MSQLESRPEQLKRIVKKLPIDNATDYLQTMLGQGNTAYAIGERDPRRIREYAEGTRTPDEAAETALRGLTEVMMALIYRHRTAAAARGVLFGANPILENHQLPIDMFNQGEGQRVVDQAWSL